MTMVNIEFTSRSFARAYRIAYRGYTQTAYAIQNVKCYRLGESAGLNTFNVWETVRLTKN